ncbi:MAG: hypothetical protein WAZ20_07520 [Methanothrix sp.]|uniref:hypothetical protein n=2 Tax=Methanothrix sp. TaxID=90426 RepID=UPI00316AD4B6
MPLAIDSSERADKNSIPASHGSRTGGKDMIDLELIAAKEILAEVFDITFAEAEEMIKQRSRERTLWPEKFADNDISRQQENIAQWER